MPAAVTLAFQGKYCKSYYTITKKQVQATNPPTPNEGERYVYTCLAEFDGCLRTRNHLVVRSRVT